MKGFGLKFKKGDLSAALFVVLLTVLFFFASPSGEKGGYVTVTLDGREIARLDLSEDTELEVGERYRATVAVKDGRAFVKESDCPNQDCVHSRGISKKGQSIVCLPGGLTLTVAGEDLDAVIG